jgi:hypothetical protein
MHHLCPTDLGDRDTDRSPLARRQVTHLGLFRWGKETMRHQSPLRRLPSLDGRLRAVSNRSGVIH